MKDHLKLRQQHSSVLILVRKEALFCTTVKERKWVFAQNSDFLIHISSLLNYEDLKFLNCNTLWKIKNLSLKNQRLTASGCIKILELKIYFGAKTIISLYIIYNKVKWKKETYIRDVQCAHKRKCSQKMNSKTPKMISKTPDINCKTPKMHSKTPKINYQYVLSV